MCNCCVIVILFEELFKSSVTGEVEARDAGKGEEERKIGSQSGPEWAGSGGGVVRRRAPHNGGEEMDSVAAGSMTGRQW